MQSSRQAQIKKKLRVLFIGVQDEQHRVFQWIAVIIWPPPANAESHSPVKSDCSFVGRTYFQINLQCASRSGVLESDTHQLGCDSPPSACFANGQVQYIEFLGGHSPD